MKSSFRSQLFIVVILIVSVAIGVTIFAVLRATDSNIRTKAREELEVARQVFSLLMTENSQELQQRAEVLSQDFAFRKAIATNEEETIISALANHGERIKADMMLLVSADGEPVVGTHEIEASTVAGLKEDLQVAQGTLKFFVMAEGRAYQTMVVPVKAPNIIAWVILGFSIEKELAKTFKQVTKAEILFISQESPNSPPSVISTLDKNISQKLSLEHNTQQYETLIKTFFADNNWLTEKVVIWDKAGQRLVAIMANSMEATLDAYYPLKLQMVLIAAIAMLISALITYLISLRVTRPIDTLMRAAKRIAVGNYNETVNLDEKNEFGLLGNAINSMQTAIFDREQKIKYQAEYDLVTHLPNQNSMTRDLMQELTQASLNNEAALGILQISNFEQLVDLYGVQRGNSLLAEIAERLKTLITEEHQLARHGDKEFLLYTQKASESNVYEIMLKIVDLLTPKFKIDDIELSIEVKAGFAIFPFHGEHLNDLMRRAQIALNTSHQLKRDYCVYEQGQDEAHLRQIKITHELQKAIQQGEFSLHYQPKYNLNSDRVEQVEALLRWNSAEMGPMRPDEFIPIAEKSGDIRSISHWVLEQAIEQLEKWHGINDIGVSINLSAKDILDTEFIYQIMRSLESVSFERSRLVLEITESAMILNPEQAIENLQKLKEFGVLLSMDDFGTGYSSLSQLKLLPIHELKIDKSFVINMDKNTYDQQVVQLSLDLGHHLGLQVVVEGVETKEVLDMLKNFGCDAAQGYYFCKPMPAEQFEQWFSENIPA